MLNAGHTRRLIPIGVDFWNDRGKDLPDGRRLDRDHARKIVVAKLFSKIIFVERRQDSVGQRHSGNCRKTHRGMCRRSQFSPIQTRILTWRRKRAFHDPIHQCVLQGS